jgi:hypothetical protein
MTQTGINTRNPGPFNPESPPFIQGEIAGASPLPGEAEPYADIGSIRLASLFLTLPTRWLTGHATIAPVYGTSIDFS